MNDGEPLGSGGSSIPQPETPARRPNLIQFSLGQFRFSAPLVPILAVLVVFPVLLSLGFWQLDRAAQKIALQSAFAAQLAAPAQGLSNEQLRGSPERYLKTSVEGLLGGEQQFLLDNRVHQGRAGYEVLAPLVLDDGSVLLVNRGWVPVGGSRQQKPDVAMPPAAVQLQGIAAVPPQRFSLGDSMQADDGWPKVLQYEDFNALEALLSRPVLPRVLQLDQDAPWAFERVWRAVEKGPTQNYGYAVQWFALALALLVLVLFACLERSSKS